VRWGWLLLAAAPGQRARACHAFALMLLLFGVGAVLIFINFLALRQAVTPAPLLGRMTSTMRWLILLPAGPGALHRRLAGRARGPARGAGVRGRGRTGRRGPGMAPSVAAQRADASAT
jgi:hypothetical protein